MAVTYGVTSTGFVRKTLQAILDSLSESQKASIAVDLDVSSDSLLGQLNGIFARELGIGWEQLEICYHGFDADSTEDLLLDLLCKLTGTVRRPASQSSVTCACGLVSGTILQAGVQFAALASKPDVRWTPLDDFTAPSTGTFDVVFVSESTGPVVGLSGDISVIATPLVGWNSVTNALDATLGRVIDDDPALRLRRLNELAAAGSTTVRAIRSALLEAFEDVDSADVLENDTDWTDLVTGLPGHSIEALISDGAVPIVADNDIAQVVWDNKAAGITPRGSSSGTATIDDDGTPMTVAFSRLTIKDVYLIFGIKKTTGYPGDDVVAEYVAEQANKRYGRNDDVLAVPTEALPLNLAGVKDITDFHLGFTASPTGTSNLTIGLREIARFDTSRIIVTSA